MVKSFAFGQARWDNPLRDLEDRTVWLAKWEMVEISRRERSKELLRPESMVKSLAFGQARWDNPLRDLEDRTVWLAKWEMSVNSGSAPIWGVLPLCLPTRIGIPL